mmetsp:Transcript_1778/g.5742  ORF Transcript_1778/g.5742 Transcript_1778/m.5742 type:complete len:208 (-) Transcript_1778:258-881(-)
MLSSSMKDASCRPSFSLVTTMLPAFSPGMRSTIHAFACLMRWPGFMQISKTLSSTGERTWSTMGSASPGSTLSSRGPGRLNPGPSTSSQPGFSAAGSTSTHSPPEGPVQVLPVVLTLDPTLRLSLVILALVGSAPSFLMRGPCTTRHSEQPPQEEPPAASGPWACSGGAGAGASGAAAGSSFGASSAFLPTPARMSFSALFAARLTS